MQQSPRDGVGTNEPTWTQVTSTPFQSSIKSEKVHARTFEWMEDSIRAAGTNALVEGANSSDTTVGEPTLRSNVSQIIGESFKIAATVDAIKTHGRAKETALNASVV